MKLNRVAILRAIERLRPNPKAPRALQLAQRIFISLVGLTILLIGIVLIVLPGPALVVIPLGVGVLSSQFIWAEKILNVLLNIVEWVLEKISRWKNRKNSQKTKTILLPAKNAKSAKTKPSE